MPVLIGVVQTNVRKIVVNKHVAKAKVVLVIVTVLRADMCVIMVDIQLAIVLDMLLWMFKMLRAVVSGRVAYRKYQQMGSLSVIMGVYPKCAQFNYRKNLKTQYSLDTIKKSRASHHALDKI